MQQVGLSTPWSQSCEETLEGLQSDLNRGLSSDALVMRQLEYGPNELPEKPNKSFFALVLEQFKDLMVVILLGAAFVSFCLALLEEDENNRVTAFIEPCVILLILIANASVGVIQEKSAEKALNALKAFEASEANVRRNGRFEIIAARELVPGDVIKIVVGDKVPADCRLCKLSSHAFYTDQSILTGESLPTSKSVRKILPVQCMASDMANMAFSGTFVTKGAAIAVVTTTGTRTEIGKIHANITSDDEDERSPLKKNLDEFGETLSKIIALICVAVWLININHFGDPVHGGYVQGAVYYFKIAVALAVAAVPEGLPAVVTTCLALGTRAMAKEGAIVRSLPSVETLGCTTVICVDKTGTITSNEMVAQRVVTIHAPTSSSVGSTAGGNGSIGVDVNGVPSGLDHVQLCEYKVSGQGYAPRGTLVALGEGDGRSKTEEGDEDEGGAVDAVLDRGLENLAEVCTLCNEATIWYSEEKRSFQRTGDPTEAALKVLSEKVWTTTKGAIGDSTSWEFESEAHWKHTRSPVEMIEFSRQRKMMSVVCITLNRHLHEQDEQLNERQPQATIPHQQQQQQRHDNHPILLTKGAPERVLSICTKYRSTDGHDKPLTPGIQKQIERKVRELGMDAFRVLAFACKTLAFEEVRTASFDEGDHHQHNEDSSPPANSSDGLDPRECEMTFLGVVGLCDPPRAGVQSALSVCQEAGIRVIMLTGDAHHTAEAVSRAIGLFEPSLSHEALTAQGMVLTGVEWQVMNKEQKRKAVRRVCTMSRVDPDHKMEIVGLLKEEGHIVAMTGDGVNDAPALKRANIGVAMGSGTAVAREASDLILANNDFSTITTAVAQGRTIFANTKQFIRYLISSNIGEVACIFISTALQIPEALIPVQLLWVNLVTDGLPATALSFNKPDVNVMRRSPRRESEGIVTRWLVVRYAIVGLYVGVAVVLGFVWWFMYKPGGPEITWAQLSGFEKCIESEALASGYSCSLFRWTVPAVDANNPEGTDVLGQMRYPSTIALSILVVIEMLNALNSLSEEESLLSVPPWSNPWLIGAIILSFVLHLAILYIPWLAAIFNVAPLEWVDWQAVWWFSMPVLLVDEGLKWLTRRMIRREQQQQNGVGGFHRKLSSAMFDNRALEKEV